MMGQLRSESTLRSAGKTKGVPIKHQGYQVQFFVSLSNAKNSKIDHRFKFVRTYVRIPKSHKKCEMLV